MKLTNQKQGTKEWLEFRRNKICASDAAVIIGTSKFKTIEKLYDEKIKGYEQVPNQYMRRGIDLEPIALHEFEKESGLIMFPAVGVHEEMDWMAASFDGMTIEGEAIVEIKCPGRVDHFEAISGKVPEKYKSQLQHQMHVSGLDFAFYFSFDGEKGIILEVKRDQDFIDNLVEKEFEFWQCLQTLTPPTIQPKTRKRKHATGIISQTIQL